MISARRILPALGLTTWLAAGAWAQGGSLPSLPGMGGGSTGPGAGGVSGLGAETTSPLPAVPGLGEDISQGMMPMRGGTVSLAGPIDATHYRVGPGDVMQIQLWGKVSRSMLLEVGPEGVILLPGTGTIRVEGQTLVEVRRLVLDRLRGDFRGVNMDLRLIRPREFRIYLTGQVKTPGPVAVRGGNRVTDVLLPALMLDDASHRRIEVIHSDSTREYADLDLFLKTGRTQYNPYLRDGDVIHVPVATDFIYASGAVARPGTYELGPSDSLLTLFMLAGDPIPAADAERALLIRWRQPFQPESLWFSLDEAYGRTVNPGLREGDRLYVYYIPQYHLQQEVSILGEVARPGVYPILEGTHRISDLVSAAGGFLPAADLSAIRVHRRSPAAPEKDAELDRLLRLSRQELTATEYEVLRTRLAGLREDYRVDWRRLLGAKNELDLPLRHGDIVRVERLVSAVRVDGEVRRPGIITFAKGLTVDDYIRQAGGSTDRAWRGKVRVTRAVTGQTLLARNVTTLDPGDLVWVPEKPDITMWEHFRDVLTAVTGIATVIIAIRSVN